MINNNNILQFNNLSQFPKLIHGFSTRFFGDLRPSHPQYQESLDKFTEALGITTDQLVRMDQVHGNGIYEADEKNKGQTIAQTDGIFTQEVDVMLGVITADCVPLLFYDPEKQLVAAVHAGWRGLYAEIITEAVLSLVEIGSKPKDILVGIGPCIRDCHYDIAKEHRDLLLEKFPDWKPFISQKEEKFFLDLPGVAKHQLQKMKILLEHIEDGDYCTFEHEDVYSARREGKDFGEMMGVIGLNDVS